MHIDHVVLWVEDPRIALDFYTSVVGLAGVRIKEFSSGAAPFPSVRVSESSILDLMPTVAASFARDFTGETKPTAAGRPMNHVCLSMDRPELEALAERLSKAGVPMHKIGDDASFGARGTTEHWFYFQDPDGNVLEARYYGDEG